MSYLLTCDVCGKQVASDATTCLHCGHREQLSSIRAKEENQKRMIANAREADERKLIDTWRKQKICIKCGGNYGIIEKVSYNIDHTVKTEKTLCGKCKSVLNEFSIWVGYDS